MLMVDNTSIMAHYDADSEGGGDHLIVIDFRTSLSKIDSPTRQPLLPGPPCVRAAPPHHRKLGAGYAALPQMAGRRVRMRSLVSLWRASARRDTSLASRLPGTTRLRFALHGAQRLATGGSRCGTVDGDAIGVLAAEQRSRDESIRRIIGFGVRVALSIALRTWPSKA